MQNMHNRILSEVSQNKRCIFCKVIDTRVSVVHHKDHNRKNNKVDNLMWLCLNCHFLTHYDKALEEQALGLSSKLN